MAQLFIGQLPFSKFFPDDLLTLFRPYGTVIAHQLHIRQGNAFVTYATTDEADCAIQALHGQRALGTRSQPIQVMYSKGTRLISSFGLQHRSVCLARNRDRQKTKDSVASLSGTDSAAHVNYDGMSMSDGLPAAAMAAATYNPMLFAASPEDTLSNSNTFNVALNSTVLHPGNGSTSRANGIELPSFLNSGRSDVSGEDEARTLLNSTVFSNRSIPSINHELTAAAASRPSPSHLTTGIVGADGLVYQGPMKWSMSPQTVVLQQQQQGTDHTPLSTNTGLTSPQSSPATSPQMPISAPVQYIVMQQQPQQQVFQGFNVPPGMSVCYMVPSAPGSNATAMDGATYFAAQPQPQFQPQPTSTPPQQQQQHAFFSQYGAATVLRQPITYAQMTL